MIPAAIRLRWARWLRRAAHRIYREPLHTIEYTTGYETKTFVDCREWNP
jgi:hypothetical protein